MLLAPPSHHVCQIFYTCLCQSHPCSSTCLSSRLFLCRYHFNVAFTTPALHWHPQLYADAVSGTRPGSWTSLEQANRQGVWVGLSATDYNRISSAQLRGEPTVYSATGALSLSVAPGRLAFTFGLQGPAVAVDTACSSSLVATHAALASLRLGQVPGAVAAAVNLTLTPDTFAMFHKAGMLSPEGRCKTLDAAADGYVRAEAAGVQLLVPAATVRASQGGCGSAHGVLGLLAGSAVNQDGRSSSLTAPHGPSQQAVLTAALDAAGLGASGLTALSMHGTGQRWCGNMLVVAHAPAATELLTD
ncbi:beta-ketoacyl synthase [Haematococcus lacustris]